jgi:hypothetical protein
MHANARSAPFLRSSATTVDEVFTVTVTFVTDDPAGSVLGETVQLPLVGAFEQVNAIGPLNPPEL